MLATTIIIIYSMICYYDSNFKYSLNKYTFDYILILSYQYTEYITYFFFLSWTFPCVQLICRSNIKSTTIE